MDQYQTKILSNTSLNLSSSEGDGKCEINGSHLVLIQNENYQIKKYVLFIEGNAISKAVVDGKSEIAKSGRVKIDIDFEKKNKSIEIHFANEIANPLALNFEYVCADKKTFDEKVEKENFVKNNETMSFTCSSGINLINAFWKCSSNKVTKVQIKLERITESTLYLVETCDLDSKAEFKSFKDLAFGKYKISIKQIDSSGKVIAEDSNSITLDSIRDLLNKLIEEVGKNRSRAIRL